MSFILLYIQGIDVYIILILRRCECLFSCVKFFWYRKKDTCFSWLQSAGAHRKQIVCDLSCSRPHKSKCWYTINVDFKVFNRFIIIYYIHKVFSYCFSCTNMSSDECITISLYLYTWVVCYDLNISRYIPPINATDFICKGLYGNNVV